MPAGRPPIPLELHVLHGTHRKDRHGDPSTLKVEGAPVQPEGLEQDALALWNRIVPGLSAVGVVSVIDSANLGAMCEWYQRYCDCSRALKLKQPEDAEYYKLLIQTQMCWKTFDGLAIQFGMNPIARAKLKVPTETKKQGVMTRKAAGA